MTKTQGEFEERAIKEQNEMIYEYNRKQDPLKLSFIERKMQERLNKQLREAIREAQNKAVLDYILSLGWQDTENEYVKEVLEDAEKIAREL